MSQPTIAQFPCPCCSSHEISEVGGYEICSICGWEDDPVQSRYPELAGGANKVSLNQARRIWLERQSLKQRTDEKTITTCLDSPSQTTERFSELLQQLTNDLRFSKVATIAIKLVEDYGKHIEHGTIGEPQASKSCAELWAFRRRIGYYDPTRVWGVDETIDALLAADCPVSLRTVELNDRSSLAIWLDHQGKPVGLIVIVPSAAEQAEQ